jgi:hypothetical protein
MILKKKYLDGTYVQVKVPEEASWPEAVDHFVHFLQGCGYIVQGYEVGDYISEQYAFQKEKPEQLPEEWIERVDEYQPRSEIKRKKGKKNAKQK